MRRRISIALLLLFACSATGAGLALLYIRQTAETLRTLTLLHRIEEMRRHLVVAVQAAQASVTAPLAGFDRERSDALVVMNENLLELRHAAERCAGCHHAPEVEGRIDRVHALVEGFEDVIVKYASASAVADRSRELRLAAAGSASELMRATEQMAFEASRSVEQRTVEALRGFDRAQRILTASVAVTFLLALLVAAMLARSITRPIGQLVRATRAIAAGDLGFVIASRDRTELGELAGHFDAMSARLREGYAALQAEIEDRKRVEARLAHDAFHDALTGLPNRALFLDRLAHVLGSSARHPGQRFGVLFVDLDRFKVFNDTLGHQAGDHLLVAVAGRLAESIRPGDTVARLGGDEFGLLLEGIRDLVDAVQVAERVHRALAQGVDVAGHQHFVTASIGIAVQSARYREPDEALRDADVAMYQAKLKGKGCSVVFDAEMHGSVVERMRLEADLRKAVEHGEEFALHYQPIVALRTRRLIAVEALVLWSHPTRGLLRAGEFVPVAEESGAIVPLGDWAFRTACAQLRAWQGSVPALAGIPVTVNLSRRQFQRPDAVDALRRAVEGAGIDPHLLAVEITEAAVMDDVEMSSEKLSRLLDVGVQIHVDDFGTGYSSLSYLHRLPITAVKIDRSFVDGLASHPESADVVKAIVSLAESLDFDVIAEGVEAEPQVTWLEALRCRYGQGNFLSPPMDAAALEAWAAARAQPGPAAS